MKLSLFCIIPLIFLNCNLKKSNDTEKQGFDKSQSTASALGFNVDGLTYEYDCTYDSVSSWGDVYRYNTLSLWAGVYSFCPDDSNSKFFFLLTHNKLNTNPDSINNGYFRMVSRELQVNLSASVPYSGPGGTAMNLRKYTPESYGGSNVTTTETWQVGFGITGGLQGGGASFTGSLSYGVSYGTTVYQDHVIMTPSSYPWEVDLDYVFQYPFNNNVNNQTPYKGDFIQRCVAVFEIENYAYYASSTNISLSINTSGTTQKVSIFGTGYEIKTSNHSHTINRSIH